MEIRLGPSASGTNLTLLASTISAIMGTAGMRAAHAQQNQLEDEILVTGSRIVRRDFEAASPIMTVDANRLENSSTISIESVLNQMPQFVPQDTQFDSGSQTGATLSLGIASLNLRGVGPNRTLVLVDGRRAQPANASLVIDVNTIPSAAVERVETITGGASAVYGADALAGVVNFILRDDFEGVDMDFQTGATQEGDGEESRFTTLFGVNSESGAGNVMLGAEWYKRDPVYQFDRDFYQEGWRDPASDVGSAFPQMAGFSPATNNFRPTQAAIDQIFAGVPGYLPGGPAPGVAPSVGHVTPADEIYFNPNGSPFVIRGGIGYNGPIMDMNFEAGDGFSGVRFLPNGSLGQQVFQAYASTPLERRSAFGRAIHDLSDNTRAFVQANYSNVEVQTRGAGQYPPAITVWSAPIPNDNNRSIPPALQTLLASRVTPDPDGAGPGTVGAPGSAATQPWVLFRVMDFIGPVEVVTTTDVYQLMVGLEGEFENRDWTWEAYASTGETEVVNVNNNLPSLQRYQSLVAQPNFGVGSFPAGRNYVANCTTGLPIFRTTDPTQDCIDSIDSKSRSLTSLSQDVVEANLQGKIVDMGAGELRFALGVSDRKNKFSYEPINDDAAINENPVGLFASNSTAGETEVKELYGELLVPVAQRLNLELGYRYSDYDSTTADTYKTLFDWSATDSVRFRGGYQVATRAANTAELFQGQTLIVVPFAPSDPCSFTTTVPWGNVAANPNRLAVQTLCAAIINNSDTITANDNTSAFGLPGSAQANGFARPGAPFFPLEIELQRGNANVKPEEAKTWTFGVVFASPGNLENFTASLDVYNIEITDAIAPVNSLFVYSKCFNADGTSNPTLAYADPGGYCKTIGRNVSTGERANVDAPFKNTGILETAGVDVAINWTAGNFYVNSLLSYLDKYDTQDAPGEAIIHNKGTFGNAATGISGGQFDYRATTTFGYNFGGGKASVGLQWRYLPSIKDESAARNPNTNVLGVDSYQMFNLFAGYAVNDRMQLRMGVDNLLDEEPPIYGSRPGDRNADQTRADHYDILGRRAYVGLKLTF